MSRRRAGKPAASVSLFPFLAVLICTMGSLVVLLVIVVQHARVQAHTVDDDAAENRVASADADAQAELEMANWRLQTLQQSQDEMQHVLQDSRLELSHLEDHVRRLEDRLKSLQRDAQALMQKDRTADQDKAAIQAQLVLAREELQRARRDLEEAARRQKGRSQSFALIPYEGNSGTRRRPIYIECLSDRVVLQPEGIEFRASDFEGPMGPGNPLDAALRTVREHLQRYDANRTAGEPYPLLVVRPDGAESYVAARGAMKSWDREFGYELVGADLHLEYPPANKVLAEEVRRTVEVARQRQQMLAMAAPRRYGRSSSDYQRGTPGGSGFGGGGTSGSSGSGDARGGGVGTGGGGMTPGGSGTGGAYNGQPGSSSYGPPGIGTGTGGTGGNFSGNGPYASGQPGGGFYNEGPGGQGDNPNASSSAGGNGGQAGTSGSAALPTGSGTATGNSSSSGANHPGGNTNSGTASGGSTQNGTMQNGGSGGGTSGSPQASGGGNDGGPSMPGGQPMFGASGSAGGNAGGVQSLANTRGKNWGLPGSARNAVGFTRPISVICSADRLVVLPDAGVDRQPREIVFHGNTADSVQELVSVLWDHIERWGIAGANAYWKPILRVEVTGYGEQRFADLSVLLEGSGIEIERKQP